MFRKFQHFDGNKQREVGKSIKLITYPGLLVLSKFSPRYITGNMVLLQYLWEVLDQYCAEILWNRKKRINNFTL